MDGHGGGRAEAERWLYTANKLLSARDLHGARSFAIRARESDPRFEATELLVAVIDTLLAGEARINDQLPDWYAILQVLRYTQNIEYIAAQYRRLAILLDPHRNPFAFSGHAFTLVHDAWSVLSNPNKKPLYDNDLRLLTEPPPPPPPPPPPAPAPAPAPPPTDFQISPPRQSHHQNHQQHHHQQQQLRKSPRSSKDASVVAEDNVTEPNRVVRTTESTRPPPSETEARTFWTACPYCYVMYEYPKVYEECTLRCQSCRKVFHAVAVRSPPPLTGEDGSFCSWGFLPLGFSGDFKDISGSSSGWNPFSPLFPCPLKGDGRRGRRGPWTYYDAETCAAFVELSDSTDDDDSDDGDWRNTYTKKGRKRGRKSAGGGKDSAAASSRPPIERPRRGIHNSAGNDNVANGEAVEGGESAVPVAARPESSKKAALGGSRRRGAGNLGKLDLNVEFSNEVEEHAPGASEGNGNGNGTAHAEDNIEGIGFFEGLDEFLSSLPILNVVGDDKVKGH